MQVVAAEISSSNLILIIPKSVEDAVEDQAFGMIRCFVGVGNNTQEKPGSLVYSWLQLCSQFHMLQTISAVKLIHIRLVFV